MARATRATQALRQAGVAFSIHSYEYEGERGRVGLQAAESLGVPPGRVLKTLMAEADGKAVCLVVPSDRTVSLKKVAAVFGAKAARMMPPADAERLTGYVVGGISPFAQKRRVPVAVEERALDEPEVFINGGSRGIQVLMAPGDIVGLLDATVASLCS
jgi:Cys-tRNA(Pro)/Cys-tRNA(Cys) deacylase